MNRASRAAIVSTSIVGAAWVMYILALDSIGAQRPCNAKTVSWRVMRPR